MSESFNPYLQWLGIRDPQRPPNHYVLLGTALFERNPEVISNAADRQMAHVRKFQTGKHSAASQQLLNELAAAKVCLLDPEKKLRYDTALRARVDQAFEPPSPASSGAIPLPPAAVKELAENAEAEDPEKTSTSWIPTLIALLIAAALILGSAILVVRAPRDAGPVAPDLPPAAEGNP